MELSRPICWLALVFVFPGPLHISKSPVVALPLSLILLSSLLDAEGTSFVVCSITLGVTVGARHSVTSFGTRLSTEFSDLTSVLLSVPPSLLPPSASNWSLYSSPSSGVVCVTEPPTPSISSGSHVTSDSARSHIPNLFLITSFRQLASKWSKTPHFLQ